MDHTRTRTAPRAGVSRCCAALELACLLVSYPTLACVLTAAQKALNAGRRQAKITKVKHCDVTNQIHDRFASMAHVLLSA